MEILKFVIEKRNHLFKYVRAQKKLERRPLWKAMTIILYYIVSLLCLQALKKSNGNFKICY